MSLTHAIRPPRHRPRHRMLALATAAALAATGLAAIAVPAHAAASGVTTAYIANQFSQTISVVNTATGVTTATIPVTGYPTDLAINAAGSTVFSANEIANTVSVIDTATNTVTTNIAVGANPDAIVLNATGTTVYTANVTGHSVSVIDTGTATVTATVPVAGYPFAIALNPAGTTAYVATFNPNALTVIDTASNTVTATIPLAGPAFAVTVNPADTTVYVGTASLNTITTVDTATNTITGTIADPDVTNMAFTPDGSKLFAVSPGNHDVTVIDPATGTITATLATGVDPQRVAVDSAGDTAYVTDIVQPNGSGTGHVFAIDTATDTVTTVTNSLADPDAIALHTVPAPVVTGISPNAGPLTAGAPVTITGTGLNGTTAVMFGADGPATAFSCTATACDVIAPAGTAGTVDVTVTTAGGTSATSPADQYTYVGAPAVTGITPSNGPTAGGTNITITGTNLTGATAITFGTDGPATAFSCTAATCTALAPAGSAGTVDVTVTTIGGTSATGNADQYTYLAPYPFTGFQSPVDNPPTINMVHAGQSIPIKFSLGSNLGLNIITPGYPTAQQVNCATGVPVNTATTTDTAGGSGLSYDPASNTYTYVWKTSKASAGTCQIFTLGLTDDTFHTADFQYAG